MTLKLTSYQYKVMGCKSLLQGGFRDMIPCSREGEPLETQQQSSTQHFHFRKELANESDGRSKSEEGNETRQHMDMMKL